MTLDVGSDSPSAMSSSNKHKVFILSVVITSANVEALSVQFFETGEKLVCL